MNRRRISFGPGAASLLLVVIVLVLSLLSLLTLTCARNDLALSRRSAQTGEQTAELFARAEKDAQRRMTFYKNLGEMMK